MISLHVKLENEYLKLNDFIEDGNITWGKNGDDGVSVNLKNVPNGKNLLADALGRELVAYRGGELCWKGFVNNITENENGIELVGRGDFHKFDYIEDYKEFFSKSDFEGWTEASAENSYFFKKSPIIASNLDLSAETVSTPFNNASSASVTAWYDTSGNDYILTDRVGLSSPTMYYVPNSGPYNVYKYLKFTTDAIFENTTYSGIITNTSIFITLYDDFSTNKGTLLLYGNDAAPADTFAVTLSSNILTLAFRSGVKINQNIGTGTTNGISTIAIVFDSSNNVKIYANKVLYYDNTVVKGPDLPPALRIGTVSTPTAAYFNMLELKVYNSELTSDNITELHDYFVDKYTYSTYYPSEYSTILTNPRFNIIKGSVSFENNCYINIPNNFSLRYLDAVVASYKLSDMSENGSKLVYFNVNHTIPTAISVIGEFYDKNNKLLNTVNMKASNTIIIPPVATDSVYKFNIILSLTEPQLNSGSFTFTNTLTDDVYFVNVKAFKSQFVNTESESFQIFNDVVLENGIDLYTVSSGVFYEGQIIANLTGTDTFAKVIAVKDGSYNGNPAKILTVTKRNQTFDPDFRVKTSFFIYRVTTKNIVDYIVQSIDSSLTNVVKNIYDEISNGDFEVSKPIDILNQLAENINYRWYIHAGVFYFIKDPPQTYYLQQSSKNISQSFDNVYTRIRTKFKNIYGFDDVSSYAEPPNRYSIVKSKSVEQQTMSRSLATVIAETVAEENARNVVKVIPQTGELYNEYGAVVRDPKPNSAVVLKNVVPELIGLGDKTYYLSEIKYNFADGTYEYVIDEPELTFELILGRAQNGN